MLVQSGIFAASDKGPTGRTFLCRDLRNGGKNYEPTEEIRRKSKPRATNPKIPVPRISSPKRTKTESRRNKDAGREWKNRRKEEQ